ERNGSGSDIHAAQQRAHERALAASVRSDDRGDLRARRRQRHALQRLAWLTRISHAHVGELDHVRRLSVERKNGTPRIAVTAPSGSSAGGSATRATRSAATTRNAPVSALAANTTRWPVAPRRRAMCGTTSPTNPTNPAAATVAAATSDAIR